MARTGRPQKVTDEELIKGVDEYLASVKIPIVEEYALLHGITKQTLYKRMSQNTDLFDSISRVSGWKRVKLERGMWEGDIPASAGIFSLKQLGFKDNPDNESENQEIKVNMGESASYGD